MYVIPRLAVVCPNLLRKRALWLSVASFAVLALTLPMVVVLLMFLVFLVLLVLLVFLVLLALLMFLMVVRVGTVRTTTKMMFKALATT